jgi:hypothetical protein
MPGFDGTGPRGPRPGRGLGGCNRRNNIPRGLGNGPYRRFCPFAESEQISLLHEKIENLETHKEKLEKEIEILKKRIEAKNG